MFINVKCTSQQEHENPARNLEKKTYGTMGLVLLWNMHFFEYTYIYDGNNMHIKSPSIFVIIILNILSFYNIE